jgi:hypothetical protein
MKEESSRKKATVKSTVEVYKGLTPAKQNLDPDEIIKVVTYPLEKALQMIDEGKITDALTILSIQMTWFYINGRSRDNINRD